MCKYEQLPFVMRCYPLITFPTVQTAKTAFFVTLILNSRLDCEKGLLEVEVPRYGQLSFPSGSIKYPFVYDSQALHTCFACKMENHKHPALEDRNGSENAGLPSIRSITAAKPRTSNEECRLQGNIQVSCCLVLSDASSCLLCDTGWTRRTFYLI